MCSFFSLGLVIDALIATRILVQFMGRIGAVALLRKRNLEPSGSYRMWRYPLPSLAALAALSSRPPPFATATEAP